MSDRTAQARAEAERRWRKGDEREAPVHFAHQVGCIKGFTQGVQWADANPKPHTITRKRTRAAAAKASDRFGGIVEPDAVGLLLGVAFLELGIEVVGDE